LTEEKSCGWLLRRMPIRVQSSASLGRFAEKGLTFAGEQASEFGRL
jgi:hypothetical protein